MYRSGTVFCRRRCKAREPRARRQAESTPLEGRRNPNNLGSSLLKILYSLVDVSAPAPFRSPSCPGYNFRTKIAATGRTPQFGNRRPRPTTETWGGYTPKTQPPQALVRRRPKRAKALRSKNSHTEDTTAHTSISTQGILIFVMKNSRTPGLACASPTLQ